MVAPMIGSKRASKREWAHMEACKTRVCIPCLVGVQLGLIDPRHAVRGGDDDDGMPLPMVTYQHCKSGNMRKGHLDGYGCCMWHHFGTQQLHALGMSKEEARARWGPNLHDNGREFRETFGTEAELVEIQAFVLQQSAAGGRLSAVI